MAVKGRCEISHHGHCLLHYLTSSYDTVRGVFWRLDEIKITISTNPEMFYFHPSNACCTVLMRSDIKEGKFVVDNDTRKRLNNSHK